MVADRLFEKVEKNGVVCVGLDTSLDYILEEFKSKFSNESDMSFAFNKGITDAILDISTCFKVQIAYYEALSLKGLEAYKNTLSYLREKNALIIADVKRRDIAATVKMYAKAHFEGDFESDFITLNPYMGMDSIDPYLPYMEKNKKEVLVLVRTSNKGAEDIEYLEAGHGKKVYGIVGEKLNTPGKSYLGRHGYSSTGGVVGCTHQKEAKEIRDKLDTMSFSIPGHGAQGGIAKDVAAYSKNGNGGIVNPPRKILLAYKALKDNKNFAECARKEAISMRDSIREAILK